MYVLVVGVVSLCLTQPAFSEDAAARWGMDYRYGFFDVEDADYKDEGNYHCLGVTYALCDNFSVELENGYVELESKSGTKLNVFSMLGTLQLKIPMGSITPYFIGGVGGMYFDFGTLREDDKKDKRCGFAYKAGGGVECALNDDWTITFEAAYLYGNTGGSATLDVYGWRYAGGIRYLF